MSRRTIFSQIQIELVILLVQIHLCHSCAKFFEVVLSLASADDLADSWNQAVHGGYRLAVLVHLHVECLNLLRIIGYEYRSLKFLLGQVSLMLGLQIASPEYLVIELIVVLLQDLDSLSVGYMTEIGVYYMLQSLDQPLIHELVKESHLLRRIFQYVTNDIF